MPLGKFCTITPQNTHFCAFWKEVLDNTFLHFLFLRFEGWPWHSGLPPPHASDCSACSFEGVHATTHSYFTWP